MRPFGSLPVAAPVTVPAAGTFSRLCHIFATRPLAALRQAEHRFYETIAEAAVVATRIGLGVIFFWFGILKLLPMSVPIDALAQRILVSVTFHHIAPLTLLHVLGVWECLIGLGLLLGRFLRLAVALLFLQMPGTFLPLILLRHETWYRFPWLPTFEGQYIIKNLVLISAAVVTVITSRGGRIITHPGVAQRAKRLEIALHDREIRDVEHEIDDPPAAK